MTQKLAHFTEFALIVFAVTLTVRAVEYPAGAPESRAAPPSTEQIQAAVAAAEAQALAINGRR